MQIKDEKPVRHISGLGIQLTNTTYTSRIGLSSQGHCKQRHWPGHHSRLVSRACSTKSWMKAVAWMQVGRRAIDGVAANKHYK